MTSEIIIKGGLKPEYYIRKRILIFLSFDQFLFFSKTTHTVCPDIPAVGGPAQFLEKFKNQPKITKLCIIVELAV